MPEVSVIVPVYNTEQYLERCLDSILAQTYQDFELILVNDGSKDNSGAICDAYAKKDSRIYTFHKDNGGQSSARNLALDWVFSNSDSQWIHFVDSDDWIHPQMLEQLWNAAQKYDVGISAVGHYDTNGITPCVDPEAFSFSQFTPEEYYISRNMNAVMPVAKLYHKSCFSNIRYPEGKIHEDLATSYRLLFAEKMIAITDMPLYFYFQNPEGTTKSAWTSRRLAAIPAIKEQVFFFRKNGYRKAYKYAATGYATEIILSRERAAKADIPIKEKKTIIRKLNMELAKAVLRYGGIYLTENVGIFVEIFPRLAQIYRKIKGSFHKVRG